MKKQKPTTTRPTTDVLSNFLFFIYFLITKKHYPPKSVNSPSLFNPFKFKLKISSDKEKEPKKSTVSLLSYLLLFNLNKFLFPKQPFRGYLPYSKISKTITLVSMFLKLFRKLVF